MTRQRNESREVRSEVSWHEVVAAIWQLDGHVFSELSLDAHDDSRPELAGSEYRIESLLLGGGAADRVSVAHVVPDQRGHWDQNFRFVTERARGDGEETQLFGGVPTPLPARWWASRSLAVRAAQFFYESGGRDPELVWEESIPHEE